MRTSLGSGTLDHVPMEPGEPETVWEQLRAYALTQQGSFTSQEAISWFARHYPGTNDQTLRVHMRNASTNVGDRSWASSREPFLTRVERGVFRNATPREVDAWREGRIDSTKATDAVAVLDSDAPAFEWHTEAHTQALLVEWLKRG